MNNNFVPASPGTKALVVTVNSKSDLTRLGAGKGKSVHCAEFQVIGWKHDHIGHVRAVLPVDLPEQAVVLLEVGDGQWCIIEAPGHCFVTMRHRQTFGGVFEDRAYAIEAAGRLLLAALQSAAKEAAAPAKAP